MHLKDQTAIVTGASRGIGKAIVLKLAKLGCNVAFSYKKSDQEANDLVKEVQAMGVKCLASKVDVSKFADVKQWITEVKSQFERIDILINNAGIIADKPLMMMSEESWREVIDTNLNGMFNAARCCIVDFMKQKRGIIINISSISGVIGLPGQTNYSASKGGMNAFTKALAKEVGLYKIRVNAIAPGFIETEILSKFTLEQKEKINETIPLGRIGSVEDVANCVEFLLSEQAQYMTGQIVQVDGGLALR